MWSLMSTKQAKRKRQNKKNETKGFLEIHVINGIAYATHQETEAFKKKWILWNAHLQFLGIQTLKKEDLDR